MAVFNLARRSRNGEGEEAVTVFSQAAAGLTEDRTIRIDVIER